MISFCIIGLHITAPTGPNSEFQNNKMLGVGALTKNKWAASSTKRWSQAFRGIASGRHAIHVAGPPRGLIRQPRMTCRWPSESLHASGDPPHLSIGAIQESRARPHADLVHLTQNMGRALHIIIAATI